MPYLWLGLFSHQTIRIQTRHGNTPKTLPLGSGNRKMRHSKQVYAT